MNARVCIDPNTRVRGNQTFSGFEDCAGDVRCGEAVEVFEQETGAWTVGVVTDVDFARRLVYIALDWKTLAVRPHAASFVSTFGSEIASEF